MVPWGLHVLPAQGGTSTGCSSAWLTVQDMSWSLLSTTGEGMQWACPPEEQSWGTQGGAQETNTSTDTVLRLTASETQMVGLGSSWQALSAGTVRC